MKSFFRFGWLLVALVVGAGTLQANPLQRSLIPEDAVWWIHVDVDQLKQTEVGRFLFGEMDKPEAQAKLAVFQAIFNFDPRQSLGACALYGRGQASSDAVLLLEGAFDAERLLILARAGEDYQSHTHRTHVIHSWIDKKQAAKGDGATRTYGALCPGGWVALGQSEKRIAEALDVLDGLIPSLAHSEAFTEWARVVERPTLLAAARRVEGLTADPRAAFLKHSSQYSLALGEEGKALFAEALLVTNDDETAARVLAIVQGLKALVALNTDDPNAIKLANSISLAQKGKEVIISLRLASADVVGTMRETMEKKNP